MKCNLLFFAIFLTACTTNLSQSQAKKIIKDYYAKEETKDGGSRIYLKDLDILEYNNSNKDTAKATVKITGTYSPNQVPGAAADSKIVDTLYWKFYKQKGEWQSNYNNNPW